MVLQPLWHCIFIVLVPHIAEVGLVEGTEHFRNVRRYEVKTVPEILTQWVDESLFFANASLKTKFF